MAAAEWAVVRAAVREAVVRAAEATAA